MVLDCSRFFGILKYTRALKIVQHEKIRKIKTKFYKFLNTNGGYMHNQRNSAIQTHASFIDSSILSEYIGKEKLEILHNIPNIAKQCNLSSKYLYKDFKGIMIQGNLDLLKKPKVAIIGTRTPNQYVKSYTAALAKKFATKGFVIISGGAVGIDSIAHEHSGPNSIMVLPSGIDTYYPKENISLIDSVRQQGLLMSEYKNGFTPRKHSFLERNRIIIALSDIIIIPQADLRSGSSSSANLSVALKKPLFVLPHRLNESLGTQALLHNNKAMGIYDLELFIQNICKSFDINYANDKDDEILQFAKNHGFFDEALQKFGNKILEYELEGKIRRNGLYIEVC